MKNKSPISEKRESAFKIRYDRATDAYFKDLAISSFDGIQITTPSF